MYKKLVAFVLLGCGWIVAVPALALTAQNGTFSPLKDKPLLIDASSLVSGMSVPGGTLVISIASQPTHGTATVDTGTTITYTPNSGYVGIDNFTYKAEYTVTDAPVETATGTITLNVGSVDLNVPVSAQSAAGAISTTLTSVCDQLIKTTPINPLGVALTDRCKEFSGTASITEKSHALQQIAPEEVAAQSTTGNLIATQQVRNVGNRLAAVRHGIEGVSVAGLSFSVNSLRLGLASGDTSATPSRLGFFMSGTGSGGNRKATTQEDGFDHRTYGLTAGLDYRAGTNFVYGGAFGYAKSNLDFADKGGGLDVGGSNISLYGTFYSSEKSYLEAVLAYNVQTFTSTRAINYTLNNAHVQKTAKGNSNSRLYALSLGGGYEVLTQKAFAVNVSGRADYLNSRMDSYRETGADELNLAIDAQKISSIMSSLGLQMSYALSYRWGVLMSQLNGSWEHKFKGDAVLIKGSFVADQTQTTFAFKGDNPDREFFLIGLGVSAVLPGGNTSFLHYETTRGKANVSDYSVSLGLRLELF